MFKLTKLAALLRSSGKPAPARRRSRPLMFESCERRALLSATTEHFETDVFTMLPDTIRQYVFLSGGQFELAGAQTASFHGATAATTLSLDGGFISNTVGFNSIDRFSGSSAGLGFVDHLDFARITLPSNGITLTPNGITFDTTLNDVYTGPRASGDSINPVLEPIPIVGPEPGNLNPAAENASLAAPTGANPGGAIRIEPILRSLADNRGGAVNAPKERLDLATDSEFSRIAPASFTSSSSTITGEWARAVVFEMAGGEPLARRSTVLSDVKLSVQTETPVTVNQSALLVQKSALPANESTTQELHAQPNVAASLNHAATPGSVATAAVSAAIDAVMTNWGWAGFELPIFEGQLFVPTPVNTRQAETKTAAPDSDDQAAAQVASEEESHHAALGAAPVLMALALERWLHRHTEQHKTALAGSKGRGRQAS